MVGADSARRLWVSYAEHMVRTTTAAMAENSEVRPEVVITVSDEGPLEAVGAAARACALSNGFEAERATRLQVVVEELIREALSRGESPIASGDIVTTITFDGMTLEVAVVDHRLPLTPAQARHLPSRRLVSLGFVNKLHVGFAGADGNIATCAMTLDTEDADDVIHAELLTPDAPDAEEGEIAAIDVRLMTPEDADNLVQCIFRCYGYSYPNQSMLKPKTIRRQLATGAMVSVVAVTETGEVVGHVAYSFERPGDTIPESGKMIVDPRYRGHHLAERLSLKRAAIAAERGISGTWSEAVTNHPASQRVAIQRGAAEVGLLVGASPASFKMDALPEKGDVRQSLIAVFTPAGPLEPASISIPSYATAHLGAICDRLSVERTMSDLVFEPTHRRSRLHTSASAATGVLEIRVGEIGRDLVDQVMGVFDEYLALQPSTMHLHLPACDPSAAWAARELERLSFAWCAWIPEFLPSGDSLLLQRVTDHPVHIEPIVCARREGEEVRDFVIDQWDRVRRGTSAGNQPG